MLVIFADFSMEKSLKNPPINVHRSELDIYSEIIGVLARGLSFSASCDGCRMHVFRNCNLQQNFPPFCVRLQIARSHFKLIQLAKLSNTV